MSKIIEDNEDNLNGASDVQEEVIQLQEAQHPNEPRNDENGQDIAAEA